MRGKNTELYFVFGTILNRPGYVPVLKRKSDANTKYLQPARNDFRGIFERCVYGSARRVRISWSDVGGWVAGWLDVAHGLRRLL
jgi:hypothetical protein